MVKPINQNIKISFVSSSLPQSPGDRYGNLYNPLLFFFFEVCFVQDQIQGTKCVNENLGAIERTDNKEVCLGTMA